MMSKRACGVQPSVVASTFDTAWRGGLGVPAAFAMAEQSYMVFSGESAAGVESVVVQELPAAPHGAQTVVRAQTRIPGRASLKFGAFGDVRGSSTGHIGFVGIGNLSAPLKERFYGSYIWLNGTVEKLVDTLDIAPGGSRRWRSISTPVAYRTTDDLSVIWSGADAFPANVGRELVVRWRNQTRRTQLLLDSTACGLSGMLSLIHI